jgi:hypothetical protein
MLAALVAGCSGDDAEADAAREDGGDAPAGDGDAADGTEEVAPRTCPSTPDLPLVTYRMRHLTMTAPLAMTNAVVNGLLNNLLDGESFVWLMQFADIGSGRPTVTTGSGHKVPDTECDYALLAEEYPPAVFEVTETGLDYVLSGPPVPLIQVALWASGTTWPGPPLTVLPLRELVIHGTFAAGHLAVGSCDEGTGECVDGASMAAKITVADARITPMPSLGVTLCGLISGDTQAPGDLTDDCTSPRPWTHEPDTMVGAEEAWVLTDDYAATAVNLVP